jgi:hypothetical protein
VLGKVDAHVGLGSRKIFLADDRPLDNLIALVTYMSKHHFVQPMPKVRPGELLPKRQRARVMRESEAVLRRIMGGGR